VLEASLQRPGQQVVQHPRLRAHEGPDLGTQARRGQRRVELRVLIEVEPLDDAAGKLAGAEDLYLAFHHLALAGQAGQDGLEVNDLLLPGADHHVRLRRVARRDAAHGHDGHGRERGGHQQDQPAAAAQHPSDGAQLHRRRDRCRPQRRRDSRLAWEGNAVGLERHAATAPCAAAARRPPVAKPSWR